MYILQKHSKKSNADIVFENNYIIILKELFTAPIHLIKKKKHIKDEIYAKKDYLLFYKNNLENNKIKFQKIQHRFNQIRNYY